MHSLIQIHYSDAAAARRREVR
ncbi:MAG: hypothetical protein QOG68_2477, partial [Solirubrobacteraceae bacterium]|nr:hypothetical protein [Solirubrobacteraceae bacterium]